MANDNLVGFRGATPEATWLGKIEYCQHRLADDARKNLEYALSLEFGDSDLYLSLVTQSVQLSQELADFRVAVLEGEKEVDAASLEDALNRTNNLLSGKALAG